jgi:predicted transcriptional regulator
MNKKKGLGPLEHQIMDIVWKQKEATVYSVVDQICKEKQLAYTTIMTVMSRLAKKGVLKREKKGKTYIYSPIESKEKFIHQLVQNTISKMVDMFGEDALAAFVDETQNISIENKKKLVAKIDNDNS